MITDINSPGVLVSLTYYSAVQWHYIDKLSIETVPNHTLITTNHQALSIYNRTKICGMISGDSAQKCASARLVQITEQPYIAVERERAREREIEIEIETMKEKYQLY